MKNITSRRQFVRTAVASSLAAPWVGWKSTANAGNPSDQIRFVCFGANGRAWANIKEMTEQVPNAKLVAVADVDLNRTNHVQKHHPEAKIYQDWRQLLDKEEKNFDAAIVATPDHMHGPIAMSTMQLGKHTYGEKPLTRTLHECRALQNFAAENPKLVTQMGNQVASAASNASAVKWLREGIVGKVKTVHSVNPKSWGETGPLEGKIVAPPETVDWEVWNGVRPVANYIDKAYHPFQWRKRLDYGTGTLGDMGCHIYHPWFMGLNQPATLEITSLGPGPHPDLNSWPIDSKIHYRMAGNDQTDGDFDFFWYDGSQSFPEEIQKLLGGDPKNLPRSGSVVVGTEGVLVLYHSFTELPKLYRSGVEVEIESEPVEATAHHLNWSEGIRNDDSEYPTCKWSYAGPMTEAVLLGTIASRLPGETLKWDSENLKFPGGTTANQYIKEDYRSGWEITGM
ncbi:MAG: Gfo/Idh/MocA family oxidoreductase [Verrucomicrobiales bacterium]|nr:Gfo/Idh/MocA family oxidoreductase [Verrucomicrobiales bacterium]